MERFCSALSLAVNTRLDLCSGLQSSQEAFSVASGVQTGEDKSFSSSPNT